MKALSININKFENVNESTAILNRIKEMPEVADAGWAKESDRGGEKPYHNRFRNVAWVELTDNTDADQVATAIKTIDRVQYTTVIQPEETYDFTYNEEKTEDLSIRLNRLIYNDLSVCKRMMDANFPTPHKWSTQSYRKLDRTLIKLVGWFGVHLVILEISLTFADPMYTHRTANFSQAIKDHAREIAEQLQDIATASFISTREYTVQEIMELPFEWDFGRLGESDTKGIREFTIKTKVTYVPHRYNSII